MLRGARIASSVFGLNRAYSLSPVPHISSHALLRPTPSLYDVFNGSPGDIFLNDNPTVCHNVEVSLFARSVEHAVSDAATAAGIDMATMGRRNGFDQPGGAWERQSSMLSGGSGGSGGKGEEGKEGKEGRDDAGGVVGDKGSYSVLGRRLKCRSIVDYGIEDQSTLHLVLRLRGSDRRLKEDVRRVGISHSGVPLYHFRYNAFGREVCSQLMAHQQEEEEDEEDEKEEEEEGGDGTVGTVGTVGRAMYVGTMAQDLLAMGPPWANAVEPLPIGAGAGRVGGGVVCVGGGEGVPLLGVDYGMLRDVPFHRIYKE